jgi:putative transposon-encoded protein
MIVMKRIEINTGNLLLTDGVIGFFQKTVTKFGTGAKIDCPKEYLNKTVYVVVCKDWILLITSRNSKKAS